MAYTTELATSKKRTPEYRAWCNMLARCKPGRADAERYWDRGVRVCDRWNPAAGGSFENFLADMGHKPGPNYSLDKDGIQPGNLLYGPGLCRWVTLKEQNTYRRNTVWLTHNGETLSLQQWADRIGVQRCLLTRRLRLGWSVQKTLETPVDHSAGRFQARTFVTYNGVTQSISEWSKHLGIHKDTLSWRLRNGWTVDKALGQDQAHTVTLATV